MGSKAAMVVFVEAGDPREALQNYSAVDTIRSKGLAERFLGVTSNEVDRLALDLAVWPSVGVVCAASLPGFDIVCSRELARRHPSELTETISRLAEGRKAYGVFMHSGDDWAAFAVWSSGQLLRSLSLGPDYGVIEDLGERLLFEKPFWESKLSPRRQARYVLPFHPIDFGNEALREFFGFILEGREDDSCVDPEEVEIPAFQPELRSDS